VASITYLSQETPSQADKDKLMAGAESEAAEDYVKGITKKILLKAVSLVKEEKQNAAAQLYSTPAPTTAPVTPNAVAAPNQSKQKQKKKKGKQRG